MQAAVSEFLSQLHSSSLQSSRMTKARELIRNAQHRSQNEALSLAESLLIEESLIHKEIGKTCCRCKLYVGMVRTAFSVSLSLVYINVWF